jgi:hypothetical protein
LSWENKPSELFNRIDTNYYMFVDESGEHSIRNFNKENPFFTVASVIIHKNEYSFIKNRVEKLKNKYWENGCFKKKNKIITKVCFISRDIRRRQGAFSKHYLTDIQYKDFIIDLTNLMESLPFIIVASVIDKENLVERYKEPQEPYLLAMTFILERFVKFLIYKKAQATVIMESRGKKEDLLLHQLFLEIHNSGTDYVNSKRFRDSIIGGYYFNKKWNTQLNNTDTYIGLEIADLVAHPIGHFVRTNDKSRPFSKIEHKLLGYENYIGKGLKVFP